MLKYLVLLAAATLVGCSTYPSGRPIDWGGLSPATEQFNKDMQQARQAAPQVKQTTCSTIGDRLYCTSY